MGKRNVTAGKAVIREGRLVVMTSRTRSGRAKIEHLVGMPDRKVFAIEEQRDFPSDVVPERVV